MHSRAARLILLFLFFAALTTTAYLFWKGESLAAAHAAQANAFDASARVAERTLLDIRSNQRGYVAAGQDGNAWVAKVAQGVENLRASLAPLRVDAVTSQARSGIDQVKGLLDDFAKADKRAVEYVRRDQRPLASDVIFADGLEMTEAALASLEQVRSAELTARAGFVDEARRRGVFAIVAGAAAAVLGVLLLVPTPRASRSDEVSAMRASAVQPGPVVDVDRSSALNGERAAQSRRSSDASAEPEDILPASPVRAAQEYGFEQASTQDTDDAGQAAELRSSDVDYTELTGAPTLERAPDTDFAGVASLCVDLARIVDTRALPSLLDRAATILDASGIILWIADPDGRELNAIFAQGYPQQLVNRLGTIPRDAQNATAAAFRTSLLQTVMADSISSGAIAAPLVTPGGCVGVMSAEVRHDAERQDMKLAAATIVAAQLATLVGPPTAKNHAKAAGA